MSIEEPPILEPDERASCLAISRRLRDIIVRADKEGLDAVYGPMAARIKARADADADALLREALSE